MHSELQYLENMVAYFSFKIFFTMQIMIVTSMTKTILVKLVELTLSHVPYGLTH